LFDVLSEVLGMLRIRTTLHAMARLNGEWGVRFPDSEGAYFHVVDGHDSWLEIDGAGEWSLGPGDVVLIGHPLLCWSLDRRRGRAISCLPH
jgi:hypothetical protein